MLKWQGHDENTATESPRWSKFENPVENEVDNLERPGFPVVCSNARNDTRDRIRGEERNRDAAVLTERFRKFNAWRNIAPFHLDIEIIMRRYLRKLPWL